MGSTRFTIDRDNTSVSQLRASRKVCKNGGSCLCCDRSWPWIGNVLCEAVGQRGLQGGDVEQKLGEIHTVVYNAGLGVWATYEKVTHEKLEMSMKTNVHGLLTVAQHVGPKMTARGEGVIAVTGATA